MMLLAHSGTVKHLNLGTEGFLRCDAIHCSSQPWNTFLNIVNGKVAQLLESIKRNIVRQEHFLDETCAGDHTLNTHATQPKPLNVQHLCLSFSPCPSREVSCASHTPDHPCMSLTLPPPNSSKHSIDVAKRQTAWIVWVHAVAIFYTLNLEIADSCPFLST